jgi:homoserine dehydrogenase
MSKANMKPINVGLLGVGTVGGGTWTVLTRNAEEITRRAGRPIRITAVADRDLERARELTGGQVKMTDDAFALVGDPDIDIVVELIGGYTVARDLVMAAIDQRQARGHRQQGPAGRARQRDLRRRPEEGRHGGLRGRRGRRHPDHQGAARGLSANRIQWIAGIINGTTNFILSEMRDKGLAFADVLAEAQRLGYAEADPTFDIEGVDAAHKATLMSAIAFGIPIQFDKATSRASASWKPPTSATPSNWATASSCWASPSALSKAWNCACIPPWCRPNASSPTSRAP